MEIHSGKLLFILSLQVQMIQINSVDFCYCLFFVNYIKVVFITMEIM